MSTERLEPLDHTDMKIPRDATFPVLTRPETYDVYAHAYWLAARNLFDCYWGADGLVPTPDYLIMPVLYLLHHYIELELKEVIRISYDVGIRAQKTVEPLPSGGSHGLTDLVKTAATNTGQVCPGETPLLDEKLCEVIEDLEEFGSKGEGLRYPETTPKQGGKPTISPYYVANVRDVMVACEHIRNRLIGCVGWLHEYQHYLQDRESFQ